MSFCREKTPREREREIDVGTWHSPRKCIPKKSQIISGDQKQRYTAHNGDRLFCRHASLERSKEAGRAEKGERWWGDGDKMKCNGSHSTATDRSSFQRISRTTRNFGSRREKGGKKAALFCKRRDAGREKNVLSRNDRSLHILDTILSQDLPFIMSEVIGRRERISLVSSIGKC